MYLRRRSFTDNMEGVLAKLFSNCHTTNMDNNIAFMDVTQDTLCTQKSGTITADTAQLPKGCPNAIAPLTGKTSSWVSYVSWLVKPQNYAEHSRDLNMMAPRSF